jgi:hypothetical protein
VRFYRAADGLTRVWAFFQVSTGDAILVRVTDSTDRTLYTESWRGALAGASEPVPRLELLHFAAVPGAYRLGVDILDERTGARRRGVIEFRGFAEDPGASDLLLAPLVRLDSASDTPLRFGEFRYGSAVVTPAALLCVSPDEARGFYLLEVYDAGMEARAGTMAASVSDARGMVIMRTPTVGFVLGTGGAMLRGQVKLEGLQPGAYQLRVQVTVGGRALERSAPFVVDSMRPAPREPLVVLRRLRYQRR